MAKETGRQKEIVGRVMHEFKHGELETRGRKVRNPRQAIAIGLSEAGASNRKSASQNRRSEARTEAKERKGQTARQLKEGRGAKTAARSTPRPAKRAARSGGSRTSERGRSARREPTRAELYAETQRRGLHGCSRMSKAELERVLRRH